MRGYRFKGHSSAFESGSSVFPCIPPHISSEYGVRRILLVEDEEDQRLLYAQELRKEGYLVLCASNGKEALRRIEEAPCDLVVLDIVMPVMDGIETLGKIVSLYKKMPIILHTDYPDYHRDFMTWLADAFVVKSSDLSVLKKCIKELLSKDQGQKYSSPMQGETPDLQRTGWSGEEIWEIGTEEIV